MGEDKQLHRPDGKAVDEIKIKRYDDSIDSIENQEEIEELKNRQKKDSMKIKELEEKQKLIQNNSSVFHFQKNKATEVVYSISPSPMSSATVLF